MGRRADCRRRRAAAHNVTNADQPYLWWADLAATQRDLLLVLWPVALAAGAWQARRERSSRVEELLATTPRPRRHRVVPTATAMAIAVVAGYFAMFPAGTGKMELAGSYFPIGTLPIIAIGALSLVAAVWLGLAVGRALPSPLTPPLLAVAAFFVLAILPSLGTRYKDPPGTHLLFPFLEQGELGMVEFTTFGGRAHLIQLVWLTALAATGLALFAATTRRTQAAALLPAVLGLAIVMPLFPDRIATAYVFDRQATAMVCTPDLPKVCVTRVHAAILPRLVGPGRQALGTLAANVPNPPTSVVEDTTPFSNTGPQRPDILLFPLPWFGLDSLDADVENEEANRVVLMLEGTGTPDCLATDLFEERNQTVIRNTAARITAALWLVGYHPPPPDQRDQDRPVEPDPIGELVDPALATLRELPSKEQRARIGALRNASLACDGRDLMDLLIGPDGTR